MSLTVSSTGHLVMRCGVHGEFHYKDGDFKCLLTRHRQVEQHTKEDYAKKAVQWARGMSTVPVRVYPLTMTSSETARPLHSIDSLWKRRIL